MISLLYNESHVSAAFHQGLLRKTLYCLSYLISSDLYGSPFLTKQGKINRVIVRTDKISVILFVRYKRYCKVANYEMITKYGGP